MTKMSILIIGSEGYIGSKLVEYLNTQHDIEKIDIMSRDGEDVDSVTNVDKYNVIIYLAAHSGVRKCIEEPYNALINNVSKFINFTKLLNQDQKFIYMSSASVYGDTNGECVDETRHLSYPHNIYDFTKQVVDEYMAKTDYNYYGLRLGTVNGKSPNTRHDLIINAMVKSAQELGYINVFDQHLNRAMLDIHDLCRLIHTIVNSKKRVPGIYNVSSFNTTVGEIGQCISKVLNVDIKTPVVIESETKSSYNFRMNTNKIEKVFDFNFQGTLTSIIDSLLPPRVEPTQNTVCKICGKEVVEIMNFGNQPFVNTFKNKCSSIPLTKYPLVLDFCQGCSFVQTRFLFDCMNLTSNEKYIQWLCEYIDSNYSTKSISDTSTCSVVDKLVSGYGWICTSNPKLTVSLNRLTHVVDIHQYMEHLLKTMGETLLLQIPYADALQNGYFDTIYHGHNNYFNLDSISVLLSYYNLYIVRIEKTDIHDGSYLLTIEKTPSNSYTIFPNEQKLTLQHYKSLEKKFNIFKLNLSEYINDYKNDGYTIVGYGANTRCNTLVNLVGSGLNLDYVIDDDTCKKGLYIPSDTNVQIFPTTQILNQVDHKLLIIPFTRKHFETIHQKLIDMVLPTTNIAFLKLFPEISTVYRDLDSNRKKIKTTVIMHFYNEEYLLPYWLNHHKYKFDHGILINYNSTDKSIEIINKIVPNWTLINTTNSSFDLRKCDEEVMAIEKTIKGWKMALNVTEFLCCDLTKLIEKYQDKNNAISIHCIPMVESIEYESNTPLDMYQPLIKQRTFGLNESFRKTRTIHCAPDGQYDGIGRHFPKVSPHTFPGLYEAVVLWYGFSPFNDAILQRKLQIQQKMTESDKINGIGREHVTTREALQSQFENYQTKLVNFKNYTETAHHFKNTYLCW